MDEIRIEARVRNNVLWHAIYDRYRSAAAFCRAHWPESVHTKQMQLGRLLNLNEAPTRKDGDWRTFALEIADALRQLPEDLYPSFLYEKLMHQKTVVEISYAALPEAVLCRSLPPLETPEERLIKQDLARGMARALATLTPREEKIIRQRYGIGGGDPMTLDEASEINGVSAERLRQHEAKALKKLRHPDRSRPIKEAIA